MGWQADEHTYAGLLDALTRDLLDVEATEREMVAAARRSLSSVQEEQQRAEQEELAEARRELGVFRAALERVRDNAGSDGGLEVPFDAADPEQDAQADALVQYLVRPDYAEVRTEELGPGRYVYHVRVQWDRLRALAKEHNIEVPW